MTCTRRKANQDFHQLITVVDAKFQDTNDDTALPEELSTSGWWSSTAGLSAPHRENDCISERCLLKHYRLWNDGLRPALARRCGERKGRGGVVRYRHLRNPISTSQDPMITSIKCSNCLHHSDHWILISIHVPSLPSTAIFTAQLMIGNWVLPISTDIINNIWGRIYHSSV